MRKKFNKLLKDMAQRDNTDGDDCGDNKNLIKT